ncbi:MAG: FmdB family zinc ribbon protein [Oligoflexales bacterium]
MPIYEFECQACLKISEKIMSSSDPLPSECETCGKGPVRKLVSQSAFILKGGGWYSEGYTSTSSAAQKSSSHTKASDTASESKPESKPAPAKEPSTPST